MPYNFYIQTLCQLVLKGFRKMSYCVPFILKFTPTTSGYREHTARHTAAPFFHEANDVTLMSIDFSSLFPLLSSLSLPLPLYYLFTSLQILSHSSLFTSHEIKRLSGSLVFTILCRILSSLYSDRLYTFTSQCHFFICH